MERKQQSPNWERHKDTCGFVEEGFPFDEGFPEGGPFGNVNKLFEVIFRDGTRYEANVDYSQQYMADGLRWKTVEGDSFGKGVIVAWREL